MILKNKTICNSLFFLSFQIRNHTNRVFHSNEKFSTIDISNETNFNNNKKTLKEFEDCFCVRYSKNDLYFASGYLKGYVNVFDLNNSSGDLVSQIKVSDYAVTSIRFKGDYSLMAVTADGKISTFHTPTGKLLYSLNEKNNAILSFDVSPDKNMFATGGHDKVVKLYDDDTKTLIQELHGSFDKIGHSNRIFSINFHKTDKNLLASGGWDSLIVFYDLRDKKVIGNALGAHIIGDAIDMKGNYILTASGSSKEQIKIFDIRTFKKVETIKWEYEKHSFSTKLYCAQFSKSENQNILKNLFSVGGYNINQWRLWDFDEANREIFCAEELFTPIYSMDFSNKLYDQVSFGCGNGKVLTYKIKET